MAVQGEIKETSPQVEPAANQTDMESYKEINLWIESFGTSVFLSLKRSLEFEGLFLIAYILCIFFIEVLF